MMAGNPPGRLGNAVAKQGQPDLPDQALLETVHAEFEKGAAEESALQLPDFNVDPSQIADPLQRMLVVQMQQNTLLLQKMMQPKDTMASLLSGGGANESGSSSGGGRGCVARDVFLRSVRNLGLVAEMARSNALQELGISRGSRRQRSDAPLHREEDSTGRSKVACPLRGSCCGRLVHCTHVPEPGDAGVPCADALLCGTMCIGCWPSGVGLAHDGLSRTQHPSPFSAAKDPRSQALYEAMQPAVGQCQFGLPAGFGLSGWENSDPGETKIEGQCSSRGSRKAQTKSQSKAREGKERRGKRWREPGLDSSLGPVLSEVGKAGSLTDHLGVQFESRQPPVQPSAMSQQPNAACRWSSLENVLSSPCSGSGNCTDQLDPSPDSSPLHPPPTRDRPIDNDCPVSGRVFNPYNLMQTICRESLSARTALGQFCRESLLMQEASHVKPPPGRPLWPVPLPRWCWTPCKQLNPRRRRRNRQHRIRFEAVRLILACLNWEVLGHPVTAAPFESQLRCPISPAQHLIIEHLENLVNHHLCCGDFVGEDLGRFQEKYSSVIRLIQELPQCQAAGEDLESVLIELHRDMDPYHGHFGRGPPKHEQCHQPNADHECTFERKAHLPSSGARDVKSSRIKWQFPPSFEAGQFPDPSCCESCV